MSFREMFLAEHPIDGVQMLEEARIKAAKGSALFDALETHMKQELLTKLREGVEGLDRYYSGNEGLLFLDATGHVVLFADVLALIADIEKGGE